MNKVLFSFVKASVFTTVALTLIPNQAMAKGGPPASKGKSQASTSQQCESVNFDFSAPPPSFGGDANGFTNGVSAFFGIVQKGKVTWNNPLILDYGLGGTGKLKIELTDTTFNKGFFGLK